jgi:hypothetical protein
LDIGQIAEAVAATLAPVLPYLVKAGGKAAEAAAGELGKAAGGGVSQKLKDLWERMRPQVEAKSAAAEAASDVAGAPDVEGARAAWRWQVRKILEADPSLAREMVALLEGAGVRDHRREPPGLRSGGAKCVSRGTGSAGIR